MALSSDLISKFVKATKDNKKTKNETTVYGTIEEYDGTKYVRIDGSELLTPVSTTVDLSDAKDGERVAVMVKNHTAIATGNASSPAARIGTVQDLDGKVGVLYADYVETKELVAKKATIEQLNATNANIEKLEANKASVEQLTATNALINNLKANKADVEELEAERARIDDLDAKTADIEELEADSAFVKNLNAAYANINFANINMAAVEKIFSGSGIIEDLVVSGERITGELVGVTIKGDLIEGNTIKADKLVVKGSDGLFYKLNFEGGALTGASPSGEICYYRADYDEETDTYSHGEEDVSDSDIFDPYQYCTVSTRIDNAYTTDGLEVYSLDLYSVRLDGNGEPMSADSFVFIETIDSDIIVDYDWRLEGVYRGTFEDEDYYYTLEEGDPDRPYELSKTDYGFYCVTKPAADWAGNGLHGSVIVAKSIVAEKIAVDDLVAFDATIGGFNITKHSLYSGVKESVENDTRGSYIDDEGQVAFGDSVNYLKYYKEPSGTYDLKLDANGDPIQVDYVAIETVDVNGYRNDTYQASGVYLATLSDGTQVYVTEDSRFFYLELKPNYTYKLAISADSIHLSAGDQNLDEAISKLQNSPNSGINLLPDSNKEVTKAAGASQAEFVQYADLAPIFEKYGLIEYTLSFDIKSADVSKNNLIAVYCQNDSSSLYSIGHTSIIVTTGYTRHSITFTPTIRDENEEKSMLAFYGIYGTGNIPAVKNVKLEKGNRATDWTPAPDDYVTMRSEMELLDDRFSVEIETTRHEFEDRAGVVEEQVNTITKHLNFDGDGLSISASDSDSKVIVDNDDVSILVKDAIVQKFDADGRALIPQLVITEAINLLGYDLSLDNKRNLNCDYVGIKLEFLKNLSDMTVSVGETVVLSVVAIGEDVTYDWLQWDATVQQYERVANGSTYTVDTSTAGKQYFYCCAYDMNGGMKYSNGCCVNVV